MEIKILEFTEGAKKAEGVAVIIDVFRAFSVACYAYNSGVSAIIATGDVNDAFLLKERYKNSVIAGERQEKKFEGFDFGNSPSEIVRADIKGKTFIHTTSAGTQGLVSAKNADIVLTGSLVNASAIVKYIRQLNPGLVSLVAMGYRANASAEEDVLCAGMIRDLLCGRLPVTSEQVSELRNTSGKRFFNPENKEFSPPEDFFLCTAVNKFDFVLRAATRSDGNMDLIKIDV
jgi:2-phosphosulfolactate phosphatase